VIDTVGNLVQTLVVIVVVTTILDMLLPQTRFRQYLRLVVGMLVLLMVVNAFANLLGRGEHYLEEGVPPWGEEAEGISRKGKEVWEKNQQAVLQEYRGRVEEYVKESLWVEGWSLEQFHLKIDEDFSSASLGRIKEVQALVRPRENEAGKEKLNRVEVEPVRVEIDNKEGAGLENAKEGEISAGLGQKVASRLGISEEKVEVKKVP